MPAIEYRGQSYSTAPDETVLDALLRHGIEAPHSCKVGTCGSCMMRAETGVIPVSAQVGMRDSWKAQRYFLPCICRPESDLSITEVGSDAQVGATIGALELLSADVLCVRLACDAPIELLRAGQYVTLVREGGLARSYSVASLPKGCDIELHVRRIASGRMSGWLHEQARVGDRLSVLGPSGDCFYVPGDTAQPMLLVGTGTGLAPLLGIVHDALQQKHQGPIHLFHGALTRGGLYLVDRLRQLAAEHANFEYVPAVLNGDGADGIEVGTIDQVILRRFPKLNGWRAYICGDPAIVQLLKKKVFLAGVASRDIHADPFLAAK